MVGELNININYQPSVKYCALCNQWIDCKALPRVYTKLGDGREVHYKCLQAPMNDMVFGSWRRNNNNSL